MRKQITAGVIAGITVLGGVGGVAAASGGTGASAAPASAAPASRLDDGKQLLSQSKITEQQAIAAAQGAAQGDLNEVDLEQYNGKLAWNVDVGSSEVKVDPATGQVDAVTQNN